MKRDSYPKIRYKAVWGTRQLVKVRVDKIENSCYPFRITLIENDVKVGKNSDFTEVSKSFDIVDFSFITLYKTRAEGEKKELQKLNDIYSFARRELRKSQQNYKLAMKHIEEYKNYGSIQSI